MQPADDPTIETADGHRLTLWRRFGNPAFKARGAMRLIGWDPSGEVLLLHPLWDQDGVPWVERWNVRTGERLPPTLLTLRERVAGFATDAVYSPVLCQRNGSPYWSTEVWDFHRGALVATLPVGYVRDAVAMSADGRLVAHSSVGHPEISRVTLTALPGGAVVAERNAGAPVAVSPDGSLIASRSKVDSSDVRYPLEVWRPDGTLVAALGSPGEGWATACDFSRDGRRLVAALSDGEVVCWEVATGERLWRMPPHDAEASEWVDVLARSADGETYFTLDRKDHLRAISAAGAVRWRVALTRVGNIGEWAELRPSPDGASLAVRSFDRPPRILDAATGVDRTPVEGHRGLLTALALSPDGRLAASADDEGEVRVYDLATGDERWVLEAGATVRGLAFTRDGRSLRTAARDGGVRRWSLATGMEEAAWRVRPAEKMDVVASPDGARTLVTSERRVQLWSDRNAKVVQWSRRIAETSPFEAAFCDAESRIVVAVFVADWADRPEWALLTLDAVTGKQVGAREVARARLVGLRPADAGPLSVAVAGDRLELREAFGARREVAVREASAAVRVVDVSADGRWMALADGDEVELWSLAPMARCVAKVRSVGDLDAVARIALSPDGGLLVVGTARGVVAVYARTEDGDCAPVAPSALTPS